MAGERQPTVAEIKASRPAVGTGSTTERKPLGVPSDYVATRPPAGPMTGRVMGMPLPGSRGAQVPPTFYDEHVWMPATLPPGQVARLQDTLASIGLLDEYRRGYWDPKSQSAYKEVLEFANAAGITDEMEAIRRIGEMGGLGGQVGGSGGGRAPLTVRQSNPLDIKAGADAVAQNVLGRKLRDDELPKFITAIQQMERSAQSQQYAMSGSAGGTMTEPPSIEAFVEQKLRADNPNEAMEMDMGAQVQNFIKILGAGD